MDSNSTTHYSIQDIITTHTVSLQDKQILFTLSSQTEKMNIIIPEDHTVSIGIFACNPHNCDLHISIQKKANASIKIFTKTPTHEKNKLSIQSQSEANSSINISALCSVENHGEIYISIDPNIPQQTTATNLHTSIEGVLLGKSAKIHSLPLLSIHTNEVESASHAFQISVHHEEDLFYLASKGIKDPESYITDEKQLRFLEGFTLVA